MTGQEDIGKNQHLAQNGNLQAIPRPKQKNQHDTDCDRRQESAVSSRIKGKMLSTSPAQRTSPTQALAKLFKEDVLGVASRFAAIKQPLKAIKTKA